MEGQNCGESSPEEQPYKYQAVLENMQAALTLPRPQVELSDLDVAVLNNFRVYDQVFKREWQPPQLTLSNFWLFNKM